ncbi:hypothetical protein RB623_29080 [Mesorhizobium sp. LHD-90]|uniref:hypothetical protein n=1 Tax=Mesorhizobium sp. LHD-90 TaxID=3071414 RepID=UPI0027E1DF2F|nr:hypothetical protein [Mesorhizobium sp. LHD-90]MDQ6438126.1 hypothetical protein [Mesorhizobium sp. LHD-90]
MVVVSVPLQDACQARPQPADECDTLVWGSDASRHFDPHLLFMPGLRRRFALRQSERRDLTAEAWLIHTVCRQAQYIVVVYDDVATPSSLYVRKSERRTQVRGSG